MQLDHLIVAVNDRNVYEYPRYAPTTISVARRDSVALLDRFVGPKR